MKLYNTAARKKQLFVPQNVDKITMYVCGPTVYDVPHLGNARSAVVFDLLFRILKNQYPQVIYARNFTDIDDKIIKASKQQNIPIQQLTVQIERQYLQDMRSLNVHDPQYMPRATQYIDQTIELIQKLIDRGFAYENNNHVLFQVQKFSQHGQFANKKLEDLIAGARVEPGDYKRNPEDFILWKPSQPDEPGWTSPWGRGRMGWHSECAAMIKSVFDHTIDIHGGGMDLIFPHHENEIAQTSCAHDHPLANYWVHNNMLLINGEKMSKSLGNFLTVGNVLSRYHGSVVRLALLSTHYRQPLNWTEDLLKSCTKTIGKIKNALWNSMDIAPTKDQDLEFNNYLLDDINSPGAIARLHRLIQNLKSQPNPYHKGLLINSLDLLGISVDLKIDDQCINNICIEWHQARSTGDYHKSDLIRDQLQKQGIDIQNIQGQTAWKFLE